MSLEGAILARLKAVSAVTDIVGAGANARIYAMVLPQNPTLEAISFQRISAVRLHAFGADPGLQEDRFQVNSWGSTFEESRDLADAVLSALSRFSGTLDSTEIQGISLDNELDLSDEPTETTRPRDFRVLQDYLIWHVR